MKYLVDEDLPPRLAEILRNSGREAIHVAETPLRGGSDNLVFEKANTEGWILVTEDRGLGDTRFFRPSAPAGTIVFRFPPGLRAQRRIEIAVTFLLGESMAGAEGSVMIVEAGGRTRRPDLD